MGRGLTAVAVALMFASPAAAQTLEERVRKLEAEAAGGVAPEPGKEKTGSAIEAYFADGFRFKSTDGNFEARIAARLIVHGRAFLENNERVSSDTFSIRQARFQIDAKLFKDWEVRVQPTASNGTGFALDDGYVGFIRWQALKVKAGQFKAPFGFEQLTTIAYIDLPERSLLDRLVPGREVGVQVYGEVMEKVLGYAVMLSNGTGKAASDENSDKDLTGRVWVRPGAKGESGVLKGLHLGLAGTWGRQDKSPGALPYTYSSLMTATPYATAGPNAATVEFDRDRIRVDGEFAWLLGPASVKAEYLWTRDGYTILGPNPAHSHTNTQAFLVSATVFVTGEAKTWDKPKVKAPLFDGGIGAVEIAARFSRIRLNSDLFEDGIINNDASARRVDEYAIGVNWYPNPVVRISLAYALLTFESGEHHTPVVVNGRAIDDEDVVIFRAQVDF